MFAAALSMFLLGIKFNDPLAGVKYLQGISDQLDWEVIAASQSPHEALNKQLDDVATDGEAEYSAHYMTPIKGMPGAWLFDYLAFGKSYRIFVRTNSQSAEYELLNFGGAWFDADEPAYPGFYGKAAWTGQYLVMAGTVDWMSSGRYYGMEVLQRGSDGTWKNLFKEYPDEEGYGLGLTLNKDKTATAELIERVYPSVLSPCHACPYLVKRLVWTFDGKRIKKEDKGLIPTAMLAFDRMMADLQKGRLTEARKWCASDEVFEEAKALGLEGHIDFTLPEGEDERHNTAVLTDRGYDFHFKKVGSGYLLNKITRSQDNS